MSFKQFAEEFDDVAVSKMNMVEACEKRMAEDAAGGLRCDLSLVRHVGLHEHFHNLRQKGEGSWTDADRKFVELFNPV